MNHVELQYQVLKALEYGLDSAHIEQKYNETIISFLVNDERQRAKVKIEIVDCVYCVECGDEIVNPSYQQDKHDKCKSVKKMEVTPSAKEYEQMAEANSK